MRLLLYMYTSPLESLCVSVRIPPSTAGGLKQIEISVYNWKKQKAAPIGAAFAFSLPILEIVLYVSRQNILWQFEKVLCTKGFRISPIIAIPISHPFFTQNKIWGSSMRPLSGCPDPCSRMPLSFRKRNNTGNLLEFSELFSAFFANWVLTAACACRTIKLY